ncbi:MAG: TatD family hydrolase [Methylococcales bacterium]|jgi:TatD DNase family protein|nr:TatD family hydrolase [Methylococcales bacterium]MBT7409375.1 TatD family hydrolase [Methylococcales bacterium]
MIIDSHCHLDRVNLEKFDNQLSNLLQQASDANVKHMLCVSINLEDYDAMLSLVEPFPQISVSVGVHPTESNCKEPNVELLIELSQHEKNVAIGETGLDYHYDDNPIKQQHERLVTHIEAAKQIQKPLIIHTREAAKDTIALLKSENARDASGVIHCFTEDWAFAKAALDLNFYISFSGIVTFKNALKIKEVAKKVPDDRFLVETDSPYLAPVPFRGKPNYPLYVPHVVEHIATLRQQSIETISQQSTMNFCNLFQPKLAS